MPAWKMSVVSIPPSVMKVPPESWGSGRRLIAAPTPAGPGRTPLRRARAAPRSRTSAARSSSRRRARAASRRTPRSRPSRRSRSLRARRTSRPTSTWPVPGVERSFSERWTWTRTSAHARSAAARILLFDVGVKGVVHHPDPGVIDLAHERGEVRSRVREVHLEAVQVLERDRDAALVRVRRHFRAGTRPRAPSPQPSARRRRRLRAGRRAARRSTGRRAPRPTRGSPSSPRTPRRARRDRRRSDSRRRRVPTRRAPRDPGRRAARPRAAYLSISRSKIGISTPSYPASFSIANTASYSGRSRRSTRAACSCRASSGRS